MLYADETIVWRFALPRAGWWRKTPRVRLPTRPLSPSQIKREESLKRDAWARYRSWTRVTSGVLLSVIGAVQYGTSKVFYRVVPHFDTEGFRQYIHQLMARFGHSGKPVVMVVDRSGIHRAHKLTSTLAHWQGQFRLHLLPAHCGHHLNPIEGFWRVMKRNRSWTVFCQPPSLIPGLGRSSWGTKSDRFMSSIGSAFRLVLYRRC